MLRTRVLRRYLPFLVDAPAWTAGLSAADLVHFRPIVAAFAVAIHAGVGQAHHLYRRRHPVGSFEEVRAVTATVVTTAVLLVALDALLAHRFAGVVVPARAAAVALVLMLGARYAWRLLVAHRRR